MTATVTFEETGETRKVRAACKVCRVTAEDVLAFTFVLSPSGMAHHTRDFGETLCGRDATRDGWWWPL